MFREDPPAVDKVVEMVEQLKELGIPFTIHIRNGDTIITTGNR